MNRRHFITTAALGTAGISLLGSSAWASAKAVRLTILHTNDMHSRIEPFPNDGRANAGMGGMARRASLIRQIRQQEPNVLLLDAGDVFQGTPYFNFFGGELEFKLMSQMGYDAATLGNHDFDNGLEGLARQLPHAKFPFLSANYDFSDTLLQGRFQPYKVFKKQGVRIGVFGVGVELEGLVGQKLYGRTRYLDPVQKAQEITTRLREREECDLVVCLSHLGYKYESDKVSDQVLARQVRGLDLIIGGHTHTFLEKPDVLQGPDGRQVLVNQVGWAGVNLGRIDYVFDPDRKMAQVGSASVLPVGLPERLAG